MSCVGRLDVVCRSLNVEKMSVLAPILEASAIDATHDKSERYGKRIRNSRSKSAILAVQNRKNTRKHGFGDSGIRTYVDSTTQNQPDG